MRARYLPFLFVVLAVSLLLHGYVAYRLLISLAGVSSPVALSIAAVVALLLIGALLIGHGKKVDSLAVLADTWLGIIFQLFVWCLLTEPVRLVLWQVGVSPGTRNLIAGLLALASAIIALGWGAFRALGPIRPRLTDVVLPRLPAEFDGLRIVQIADTHASSYLRTPWMRRLVDLANAQHADVVVHTGDLADGPVQRRTPAVRELSRIEAPQRFFITGNHEYLSDAKYWGALMGEIGWDFLHNQHRIIKRGGTRIVIAGIDDPTGAAHGVPGHGPNLDAALAGIADDDFVLLLAHQPSQLKDAVRHGGVDLQLSGHTHGGQMWPFHYLVRLDQKIVAGLAQRDGTAIYVSRGAGFWGPPFRIGAPPELTVLTLRRSP